jgi:hypothetical protein
MDETAKAVQELAKATGKAIDASEHLGGFVAQFIRAPLQEMAGIWTDSLRYRRWENQLVLQQKARQKLEELGGVEAVSWREVPMRLQVPLLEAASLIEEDELRDLWANLLLNFGNASSGVSMERSFISVLRELSPFEAAILERVFSIERTGPEGVLAAGLPDVAELEKPGGGPPSDPSPEVALALSNLVRLGCLSSAAAWDGGEFLKVVFGTTFGRELVRACRLQTPIPLKK